MTRSFSQSSSISIGLVVFSIALAVLAGSACAYAQFVTNDNLKETSSHNSSYPPIVPSSISSSPQTVTPKNQIEQKATLTANAVNSSTNLAYHPITPSTPAFAGGQQPLVLSVGVAKNPVMKGQDQIFDVAVFDANSHNQIQNAKISGFVFDPSKNSVKTQFNGLSNANGTYSYTWTIPKNFKSQTYEVRVNASSAIGSYYNYAEKPPITTFDVESSSAHNHNSQSDSSHHSHNGRNHSGENLANSIINRVMRDLGM